MKNKWYLIVPIIQLVVGIATPFTMVFFGYAGDNLARFIITLLLAVAFMILGIVGLFQYAKRK